MMGFGRSSSSSGEEAPPPQEAAGAAEQGAPAAEQTKMRLQVGQKENLLKLLQINLHELIYLLFIKTA